MAKKRIPKLTPEELARREQTDQLLRERIAHHEEMAREEERIRALKQSGWLNRLRLRIARAVAP